MFNKFKLLAKRALILNPTKANYKFVLKDWTSLKDLNILSKVLETKRFSQNIDPVIMSCPVAKNVLVIAPHPDDDVFSSGGTIYHLIQNGSYVKVIYLTSGSHKVYKDEDSQLLSESVVELEKETKKVSGRLGTDIDFWRFPNRGIKINEETINRLQKVYSEVKPDCIFLPFLADDHDDHRRSVELFYKSFKNVSPFRCEVWSYQIYSTVLPNVVIDITDIIENKLKLINLWESQRKSRDWAHYIRGLNAFNSRFLKTNQPRYAEVFFVVPAEEYLELCGRYFAYPERDLYYSDSYK